MDISFYEDHLISEIQSQPILWDPTNDLYLKRDSCREAWLIVGRNIIPDFDNFTYAKQREYLDQIRRKWHSLRAAYRISLQQRQAIPQGHQLTFLDKVFLENADEMPLNGENSLEAGDTNVRKVKKRQYNCKKEKLSAGNNSHDVSESTFLKPVLSIKKIDDVQVSNSSCPKKRGRPPKRKSIVQEEVTEPRATKSIVYQEPSMPPMADSDDELSDQGGGSKKCGYRYEVQMDSTQNNTPLKQTSAYATWSFENKRLAEYRRVTPPRNHEVHSNRPIPERRNSPPPTLRRHESYYDPRYPMIPSIPIDYNDDDMAFFRSLLTWTRRFSEDEKLEFRSEVMKLVSRMRNYESTGNYYVISQTPLS